MPCHDEAPVIEWRDRRIELPVVRGRVDLKFGRNRLCAGLQRANQEQRQASPARERGGDFHGFPWLFISRLCNVRLSGGAVKSRRRTATIDIIRDPAGRVVLEWAAGNRSIGSYRNS